MSTPADTSGQWQPPPAVYQRGVALQGHIAHAFGSIVGPGEQGQKPIAPGTQAMKQWISARFPGLFSSIGAARSPSSRWHVYDAANPQRRDLHEEGRALDLMSVDQAALERFANALVWHAQDIGLQYVLTRRREWSASRIGSAWEDYNGPSPHTDHVHMELSPSVAGDAARVVRALDAAYAAGWYAPTDASPASSPASTVAAGAAALLVGAAALVAGGSL